MNGTRSARPVTAIGRVGRRMELVIRSVGCYDAVPRELAGMRTRCDRWMAVIFRIPERGIRARRMFVLNLLVCCGDVMFVLRGHFSGGGPSLDAALSAIEGDVIIHNRRVHDCSVDVSRVNYGRVDMHDGRVIREDAAIPTPTAETYTAIAKAVVNPAIESNMRTPVSGMP